MSTVMTQLYTVYYPRRSLIGILDESLTQTLLDKTRGEMRLDRPSYCYARYDLLRWGKKKVPIVLLIPDRVTGHVANPKQLLNYILAFTRRRRRPLRVFNKVLCQQRYKVDVALI